MSQKSSLSIVATVFGACLAVPALAAENVNNFNFIVGGFSADVSTKARLDHDSGRGTDISAEDDLSLKNRDTLPWFLASWQFADRWSLEFEYFRLDRDASKSIEKDISWGDQTYPINTNVHSSFTADVYRLSVGYDFYKDQNATVAGTFGLHTYKNEASLSADNIGAQSGEVLVPLPTLGLYGTYRFNPQFSVAGRIDYFSLNYSDYEGELVNYTLSGQYMFTRNFGVGLAYRYIDLDVKAEKNKFRGELQYKFDGPVFYGVLSF